MSEGNRFKRSLNSQKPKAEIEDRNSDENRYDAAAMEPDEEIANPDLLKELFPGNAKAKSSSAHSLYIKDNTWIKLQKIAKKEKISVSAVLQKILDSVL